MSILHTVVPLQVVFGGQVPAPGGLEGAVGWAPERPVAVPAGPCRWVEVAGGRVQRLISPDPLDYLDPRFQPGAPWPG